jgi:hypothetical protein
MPDQTTVRRQRVAYKQQVHELRLQFAKELQAKEKQLQEARQTIARATARGMLRLCLVRHASRIEVGSGFGIG